MDLSMLFPTRKNLKTLLRKCTIAVKATAISTGKKIAKTGRRIVPNPNPEKKVSPDARNAVIMMIISCMTLGSYWRVCLGLLKIERITPAKSPIVLMLEYCESVGRNAPIMQSPAATYIG